MRLDDAEIRAVVALTVREVLDAIDDDRKRFNGRLGYTEPEAAALIGVAHHVLRDCRLRGEITAKMVGKRNIYSRDSLLRFLEGQS